MIRDRPAASVPAPSRPRLTASRRPAFTAPRNATTTPGARTAMTGLPSATLLKMKNPLLLFSTVLFFSLVTYVFAEDVKITTSYPSPYGVYKQLQVLNQDESPTITDYTQGLIKSGLNIVTDYNVTGLGAYTPGIFWSTQNDNPTKPKAGIWMRETSTGSELYMGTSNDYTTGITNTGLILDKEGNVGIGTTAPRPKAALDVASTTKGFIPPRMTTTQRNNIPSLTAADAGMLIYNLDTSIYESWNGSAWIPMSGGTGGV